MERFAKYLIWPVLLSIGFYGVSRILESEDYKNERVTTSDARGYYAYLPALFVYDDLLLKDFEHLPKEVRDRYWVGKTATGAYIPKVTMGVAWGMLPGFLVGHAWAFAAGYATDGWSAPYQLAIALNGVLFMLLGFWILHRWLVRYVPAMVSLAVISLLFFATNMIYYGVDQNAFSHIYTFSLFAVFLYVSDRWSREWHTWQFIVLGMLAGWITLIRPINCLFALVPVGLALWRMLAEGVSWKKAVGPGLLWAVLGLVISLIPHMLYWQAATGDLVHYSYASESFFFGNPHVLDGLFSYRNGWLVYTPLMWFVFPGIAMLRGVQRPWLWIMVALLPVYIYVVFSWWCWYYGDSLSIRAMVDLYPLLALALASIVHRAFSSGWVARVSVLLIAGVLVTNNLYQVSQYRKGYITGSTMTKAAFWELFWNSDPPDHLHLIGAYYQGDNDRLRIGLPERVQRDTILEKQVAMQDFEQFESPYIIAEGYSGRGFAVNGKSLYSPALRERADAFETPYDRVLNISCMVQSASYQEAEAVFVVSFVEAGESRGYHAVDLSKMHFEPGQWHRVDVYLREPRDLGPEALIEAYVWCRSSGQVIVDDVRIDQLDCPYKEPLQP